MSRCVIVITAADDDASVAAAASSSPFFSSGRDGCNVCHHTHKSYSRFAAPIIFPSLNKSLLY